MDTAHPINAEHQKLAAKLEADGVQFAVGAWVDILGRAKSKIVPIDHLPNLLAGSERYTPRGLGDLGTMNPVEGESVALPDIDTMQILPWDRRFVFMAADLWAEGVEPFSNCPRSILKRQIDLAAEQGFEMFLGIEPEFYVFDPASRGAADGYLDPGFESGKIRPSQAYDVDSAMNAMSFLEPMTRYLAETGFGLFSYDTEGGDGQYEFDFGYFGALEMSDRMTLFKMMVRAAAKEAGLAATFMPKPYTNGWGSGAHFNMSLVDTVSKKNLFRDDDDPRGKGWSKTAYSFVAGILKHAPAIAAVATPTVNSYKRLTPRLADGTVSWAPVWISYGDNNRSCMLRLPHNRPAVENRAVDIAVNTHVCAAFMLAAGMEGIRDGLDPGEPNEELTYDWKPGQKGVQRLPRTLQEAIDEFEADPLTHEVFPAAFVTDYVDMKRAEWDAYHGTVSAWEIDQYLLNL